MAKNIEIKARCQNLDEVRKKVKALPARFAGADQQEDRFFITPQGRLKLRRSSLYGDFLIPYIRDDRPTARDSQYALIHLEEAGLTGRLLSEILGTRLIVRKMREIYLYENVRIHLDRVKELGNFIELEAVIETKEQAATAGNKIRMLMDRLGIAKPDLISRAYADLLAERKQQNAE